MLISSLSYIHQHLSITTRVLPGNEAQPSREVSSIFKLSAITNSSEYRSRSFRPYPFDVSDPLSCFGLFKNSFYFFIKVSNSGI